MYLFEIKFKTCLELINSRSISASCPVIVTFFQLLPVSELHAHFTGK